MVLEGEAWLEAGRQGLESNPSLCTLHYGLTAHPIKPWPLPTSTSEMV